MSDRPAREAQSLRLFVGVAVPDDVRNAIGVALGPLHDRLEGARWVPPRNWHVTLKFLGATPPGLLDRVIEELDLVARTESPFGASLQGFGVFPSVGRARVLWAGLKDPQQRLANLAGSIDGALAREFEPEPRPFSPHLTVARFAKPIRIPGELVERGPTPMPFTVAGFTLYRSQVRRPAPEYLTIQQFPMRGSRDAVDPAP